MNTNAFAAIHSLKEARTLFVVNPKASGGRYHKRWQEFLPTLSRRFKNFKVVETAGPAEATMVTADALGDGFDVIVSVGGDGTLNEVVNGFFSDGKPIKSAAILGVMPLGRGVDFVRTFKIPHDLAKACGRLHAGKVRKIDVGHVIFFDRLGHKTQRYFINIANIGVVGAIMNYVNHAPPFLGGQLSYLYGTVQGFFHSRPIDVRVFIDDERPAVHTVTNILIANGRFFGKGMQVAPQANPSDGHFDVLIVKDLKLNEFLRLLPRIYQGQVQEHPKLMHCQAQRLEVVPVWEHETALLEMDGEQPGHLPAKFAMIPGALTLAC